MRSVAEPGRRVRLRGAWETVWVQVPSTPQETSFIERCLFYIKVLLALYALNKIQLCKATFQLLTNILP